MKRIIFAAFAAAALIGCSNDKQIGVKGQSADNAIDFRAVTSKPTRATETDASNIRDFRVFGLWDENTTDPDPGSFSFMHNVTVTNGITAQPPFASTWTYAPIRYWPTTGDVDFFAYSPAGSYGIKSIPVKSDHEAKITYEVSPEANLQEDFLVAVNKTAAKGGSVLLDFEHALSQLVFEARSGLEDLIFHVHSVKILNLFSTGDLELSDPNYKQSGWGWAVGGTQYDYPAAIQTIPVMYDYEDNDPGPNATDRYIRLSGPNDGLMILPQSTTAGNTLVVEYSAQLSSGAFIVKEQFITISISGHIPTFEMGKKYVFQLTLVDPSILEPIVFTVDVNDWDNMDEDETTPLQ